MLSKILALTESGIAPNAEKELFFPLDILISDNLSKIVLSVISLMRRHRDTTVEPKATYSVNYIAF